MQGQTILISPWILLLIAFLPTVVPGSIALFQFLTTRKDRKAQTSKTSIEAQDTYFKQAVELSTQYREELGRQKATIEGLEKKLVDQEGECDRKIQALQDQLDALINRLTARARKSFDKEMDGI